MRSSEEMAEILSRGIRRLYAPAEAVAVLPSGVRVERHPFCEFFFTIAGECRYLLNGELLTLSPGTLCWINAWIPHQYGFWPTGEAWGEQLWFSVHGGRIHYGFFRSRGDGSFLTGNSGGVLPEEYAPLFHQLTDAWRKDGDSSQMRLFFELVLREVACRLRSPVLSEGAGEAGIVSSVKSCIRNRNGANCSLAELERILGYSRSHLSHLFRTATGISIGEYINQVRLEYVERAVRHGMKQKEIASELGFASPAAFWLWRERRKRRELLPQSK